MPSGDHEDGGEEEGRASSNELDVPVEVGVEESGVRMEVSEEAAKGRRLVKRLGEALAYSEARPRSRYSQCEELSRFIHRAHPTREWVEQQSVVISRGED